MNPLFELFKTAFKGQGTPTLIDREDGDTFISAANIYTSAIDRVKKLKKLGFGEGDILLDNPCGREAAINFIACLYFNAIYLPLSTENEKYIHGQVEDKEEGRGAFTLQGRLGTLDFNFLESQKNYSLILFTSGTYQKKPVALTAEGLKFQLEEHLKILEEFPHEHKLSLLPKFHCFGLILDLLVGLLGDKYITLYERGSLNARKLNEVLESDDIDFITGVPKHMELFIHMAEADPKLLARLKTVTFYVGGAPVNEGLEKRARQTFKDLIVGYGLTEAGPGILMNGQPLPDVEIKIMNNHLHFKSPSTGDYENKEISNGWIKTNDVFTDDEPPRPLGRSDDFSKSSNGLLHHHTEIENLVEKRFGARAHIVNSPQGQMVFLENGQGSSGALDFLKNSFPGIHYFQSFEKSDVVPLLQREKGKSTKDILLKSLPDLSSKKAS